MQKLFILCFLTFLSLGKSTCQTIYFQEDFENTDASEWTLEGLWMVGNYDTMAGLNGGNPNNTNFLGFDDFTAGANHIGGGKAISPTIDLSNATGEVILEVKLKFRNADQFFIDETLQLVTSIDNGMTWEPIEDFTAVDWENLRYDFSDYIGKSIKVAFEYSDGGGYNIGAAIDNIGIGNGNIFVAKKDYTLTVDGATLFNQCAQYIEYPIQGVVLNNGTETINSFDIEVNSDQGTKTYSFNTQIESNDVYRYSTSEFLSIGSNPEEYVVSVKNVNGDSTSDANTEDNSHIIRFEPLDFTEGKAAMVEEGTGMWCGQCVRGTAYLDELSKRFGKHFTGVSVHNLDVLVLDEYDQALQDIGVLGYPTAVLNREEFQNPDAILEPIIDFLSTPVIAKIDVGAKELSNDIINTVKVKFNENINEADYNVAVILTEDDLSFDATNWNQWNSYSGSGIPMGGFELFPAQVPSKFWPYSHVGRALIGGFSGKNEIVGNYSIGQEQIIQFEPYNLNLGWKKSNLHVIAILTDQNGTVINAISKKYYDALEDGLLSSTEDIYKAINASIYPNPTNGIVRINLDIQFYTNIEIELLNILGHKITSKDYGQMNGKASLLFDLNQYQPGNYIIRVKSDQNVTSKIITKR